jgi:putative holliday junction resolvase
MRILGLDVGDKRIGVALSDPMEILASPLTTIERQSDEQSIIEILDLTVKRDAGKILVGLPVSMSGENTEQAKKTLEFVGKLKLKTNLPVVVQDERLSSISAEKFMRQANLKKNRRKELLDAAAAAVILQSYMDTNSSINS